MFEFFMIEIECSPNICQVLGNAMHVFIRLKLVYSAVLQDMIVLLVGFFPAE